MAKSFFDGKHWSMNLQTMFGFTGLNWFNWTVQNFDDLPFFFNMQNMEHPPSTDPFLGETRTFLHLSVCLTQGNKPWEYHPTDLRYLSWLATLLRKSSFSGLSHLESINGLYLQGPAVTSWFINPVKTIVISTIYQRNQPLIRQLNYPGGHILYGIFWLSMSD